MSVHLSSSRQCRGWGTDLASPHLNDLYHKQLELYEQTRRRESLSALALAIAAPRYIHTPCIALRLSID
jgi:hypothetical protein